MDFAVPADHRTKLKESKKKKKMANYLDLARELRIKHSESDGYIYCNWCSWYSHKGLVKGREELEIRGWVETIQPSALFSLGVVAIEKGAFGLPSTMVANFTYLYGWICMCETNPY